MLRRLSIRRWVVLALCAVVFVWSWLPLLADSSFGVGIIVPAGTAAVFPAGDFLLAVFLGMSF